MTSYERARGMTMLVGLCVLVACGEDGATGGTGGEAQGGAGSGGGTPAGLCVQGCEAWKGCEWGDPSTDCEQACSDFFSAAVTAGCSKEAEDLVACMADAVCDPESCSAESLAYDACVDSTSVESAQPPPPPDGAPAGDGSAPRTYAVAHLFTGQRTFEGVESYGAWESFGYDLDHQITSNDFTTHCLPNGGAAPSNAFPDGANGVDNAFGKLVVPILMSLAPSSDLELAVNAPITSGEFTFMFDLPTLGAGESYAPLASAYFEGRQRDVSTWLEAPEFFDGASPKLSFANGYSTGNVWVSGPGTSTLRVKLLIEGVPLWLDVHAPVVTGELTADHGAITRGMISGVLDTEELIASLAPALGGIDPVFCGAALDGISNQVRQASDIMVDGSQNPSATCNGISIGLGFTAIAATRGGPGEADPAITDPCL